MGAHLRKRNSASDLDYLESTGCHVYLWRSKRPADPEAAKRLARLFISPKREKQCPPELHGDGAATGILSRFLRACGRNFIDGLLAGDGHRHQGAQLQICLDNLSLATLAALIVVLGLRHREGSEEATPGHEFVQLVGKRRLQTAPDESQRGNKRRLGQPGGLYGERAVRVDKLLPARLCGGPHAWFAM